MTANSKKSFADEVEAFATDLATFITCTREDLDDLVKGHGELIGKATPAADETGIWESLARVNTTYADVERALRMLSSTVQDLADTTAVVLGARPEGKAEEQGQAKKTAASEKAAEKSGDSKKSS
jgi:hypothetical protein